MSIATINPTTGLLEREFESISGDEIESRIGRAEAALTQLIEVGYAQRGVWMRAAADTLEADVEPLSRLLTVEMGKPIGQSRAEVLKCAKSMRFYADRAEGFLADEALPDPASVGASGAWTRYEPLGVVLAVMPWNYPLWQVIRFAAPALMAGNAGLLKHASNVPQSALYLDTLFTRGGFPDGSFQSLLIGSREVAAVIADARIKAVTLTGSEPAGRSVGATAGAHVKKTVLELGGSDPFIVLPSADIAEAARVAVLARTNNNGQSCIAGKRFIIHTDVYDAFLDAFTAQMAGLRLGDPLDEATQLGPLATEAGRDELVSLVDDALAKGATARIGGTSMPGPGWFYPATILEGVTTDMRAYAEEAFGPVATAYRVPDIDAAIALANDSRFGLSSSVWTTDSAEEGRLIRELEAGAVFVNGMTVSFPELPFGGTKDSGYGRELAASGIREFCNLKTIWRN